MHTESVEAKKRIVGKTIRVRGLVQGVGFRPFVFNLAQSMNITGSVINDGAGVLIEAWGTQDQHKLFVEGIQHNPLPLAHIESIASCDHSNDFAVPQDFQILPSRTVQPNTAVAPEAAVCNECIRDFLSPQNRRYLYPFTNCTNCGPRLTIIKSIPYDRCNTSMDVFPLCSDCNNEYTSPEDRRCHAQANACGKCGPKLRLSGKSGSKNSDENAHDHNLIIETVRMLKSGNIVAVKGLGGFQLCCDATNDEAVVRLRERKHRCDKPFALMARDTEMVKQYCELDFVEERVLNSVAAPIVLLEARQDNNNLSKFISPNNHRLGFVLPYTPLHILLMQLMESPIVFTSGNQSEEPQCIDNDEVTVRLSSIADFVLDHNRGIINRVDDSVVSVVSGVDRVMRRARGYAPLPTYLPSGFKALPPILAMGAELKNTFCIIKDSAAIVSQHIGDLTDAMTFVDYKKCLSLFQLLYHHTPEFIAVDKHPDYLSTKLGREIAAHQSLEVFEIQHHHAHVAACLADNNWSFGSPPVLAVALDGLGMGENGEVWGGEFLLADYQHSRRLGRLKPASLIGGNQAMREPWRNTCAHIIEAIGWNAFFSNFGKIELAHFLEKKPLQLIDSMLKSGTNTPKASSCGRLFDAVAAAVGICRERITYEGQAAVELEAIADRSELASKNFTGFPFAIKVDTAGVTFIDPQPMWESLLDDLNNGIQASVISARFHKGLADVVSRMIVSLSQEQKTGNTVALTGGVFQNKILFELLNDDLTKRGFLVLSHSKVPANDGGIALGQALVCAARLNHR